MRFLILVMLLLPISSFAKTTTKFCKEGGYGELTMDGSTFELKSVGLGAEDGSQIYVDVVKDKADGKMIAEFYSDLIKVPLAYGESYNGKMKWSGMQVPVQVSILTSQPTTNAPDELKKKMGSQKIVLRILMVSLAGSPPTLIGVDMECNK